MLNEQHVFTEGMDPRRSSEVDLSMKEALYKMEDIKNIDFSRYFQLLEKRIQELGGRYVEDWRGAVQKQAKQNPDTLVRRENPKNALNALDQKSPLGVNPIVGADKESGEDGYYPNAGVLGDDAYGLRIPFQRGFGMVTDQELQDVSGNNEKPTHRGIVCVLGFDESDSLSVKKIKSGTFDRYDRDPKEKSLVRMIRGEVSPEDIRFLLLRIPMDKVPEDFLTAEELDEKEELLEKKQGRGALGVINRLFVFDKNDKERVLH